MQSHTARQGNGIVWDQHKALHNKHPVTFQPGPYLGTGKHIGGTTLASANTGVLGWQTEVWMGLQFGSVLGGKLTHIPYVMPHSGQTLALGTGLKSPCAQCKPSTCANLGPGKEHHSTPSSRQNNQSVSKAQSLEPTLESAQGLVRVQRRSSLIRSLRHSENERG